MTEEQFKMNFLRLTEFELILISLHLCFDVVAPAAVGVGVADGAVPLAAL